MSHELRNPLNSIIGFSRLIKLRGEQKRYQEYLDLIHSAGNHLLKLINDILEETFICSFYRELTINLFVPEFICGLVQRFMLALSLFAERGIFKKTDISI